MRRVRWFVFTHRLAAPAAETKKRTPVVPFYFECRSGLWLVRNMALPSSIKKLLFKKNHINTLIDAGGGACRCNGRAAPCGDEAGMAAAWEARTSKHKPSHQCDATPFGRTHSRHHTAHAQHGADGSSTAAAMTHDRGARSRLWRGVTGLRLNLFSPRPGAKYDLRA